MKALRLVLVAAAVSTACTPSKGTTEPAVGLTRAEFIAVMQELRLAEPPARDSILKKHRTTEAEIRAFVQALAADPVALSATLDSVQNRVDRRRARRERPPEE